MIETKGANFLSPKVNNALHYRWNDASDLLSLNAPEVINIGEFDTSKPIPLGSIKVLGTSIKSNVTPGIRYNFHSGTNRGALNFKFELPKEYQFGGWNPYFAIEVRK